MSLYRFFAGFAVDKRVLDAGCGSGYGSAYLAGAGARTVLGIDLNAGAIRYARRKYGDTDLRFQVGDCANLSLNPESLDLVVASNVLEHLECPSAFLRDLAPVLSADGKVIDAVPPITDQERKRQNEDNPHHLSNLTVDEWLALFAAEGWDVEIYRHEPPRSGALDFTSHLPSRFDVEELPCTVASRDVLYREIAVTAVFVLSRSPGV